MSCNKTCSDEIGVTQPKRSSNLNPFDDDEDEEEKEL